MLEMVFPSSLFDMMVHLLSHIMDEIMILGPVYLHQMYLFERYMGILKGYIRNRAHPEACMIQGYHTEEIVDACINYITGIESIGVPVSRYEGRLHGKGTVGKKRFNDEGYELVRKVHSSVLLQLDIV